MRADSIAFAISGMLFGVIVGWILGTQQSAGTAIPVAAATASAAPAAPGESGRPAAAPLDEAKAKELQVAATSAPSDPAPRVQLGNLYFDAERYPEAVQWYEQAIKLAPKDPNVSTDLGVAYYYTDQADKAIQQFEHSLSVDPKHTKTMLNMGIVKAFGKQDLAGAAAAWQQVISTAPDSPEAQAAKKALDGLQQAHPGGPAAGAPVPPGS
jgi:cytochrome c-type biogenesis protein CcmH/NrfG